MGNREIELKLKREWKEVETQEDQMREDPKNFGVPGKRPGTQKIEPFTKEGKACFPVVCHVVGRENFRLPKGKRRAAAKAEVRGGGLGVAQELGSFGGGESGV
jgi:hypothetical protein